MPSLVSQAVSQSVNNIYWMPNERGCHETGRRQGLWPWGAARTMMESEKRQSHAHRKLEKQCLIEQSTRASQGVGTSPLLSPEGTGTLASLVWWAYRVLMQFSEGSGFNFSKSQFSSTDCSSEQSVAKPEWVQFVPPCGRSGALKPDGGGRQGEHSLSYICLRLLNFSGSPLPFFKVRFLMKGRTMKFIFSDLVEERTEESMCTFGSSKCSVLSYLCDLC